MAYWPGSNREAGKVCRPFWLVTTVMVMVDPAFLAVTSTPSIGPSSFDVTWPASAAAPSSSDGAALTANTNVRQTLASSALRIRIFDPPSEICILGAPYGEAFSRPSPREPADADRARPLKSTGQHGRI